VSKAPEGSVKEFSAKQGRFKSLSRTNPEVFERLAEEAQKAAEERFKFYSLLTGTTR